LLHAGDRAEVYCRGRLPLYHRHDAIRKIRAMLLLLFSAVAVAATSAALFAYAWMVHAVVRARCGKPKDFLARLATADRPIRPTFVKHRAVVTARRRAKPARL
jgi:hypothetical protein